MLPARSLALLAIAVSMPCSAQLIGERFEGDRRVCVYYGTETQAGDGVVGRTLSVAAGQECPATAPYQDPNRPAPPNAALLREAVGNNTRVCVYGEGGSEYPVAVPLTARCAMTPALQAAAGR
jgi:hypothetical protein